MAKKTKAQLIATMKRANARFKKLTPAQKRVAIAKDVLKQVAAKRLIPTNMVYVDLLGPDLKVKSSDQEVCELTAGRECRVCALGSMFIAGVEMADGLKAYDVGLTHGTLRTGWFEPDCYNYLSRFFTVSQLGDIENAFEGKRGEAEATLVKIMKNIIANRGKFNLAKFNA